MCELRKGESCFLLRANYKCCVPLDLDHQPSQVHILPPTQNNIFVNINPAHDTEKSYEGGISGI